MTELLGGGKIEPAVFHQGKMMRRHTRYTDEGSVVFWKELR